MGACGSRSWVGRPVAIINGRHIRIGDGTRIREGARLEVVCRPGLPPGWLEIGNRVLIEQGAHIVACDHVLVEDEACIAPRCTIVDVSHPAGTERDGNRGALIARDRVETRIGRRVFLGANVVVLPGVSIGANSVVGANAVVTKDIPPNCIAAGVPARVIGTIES